MYRSTALTALLLISSSFFLAAQDSPSYPPPPPDVSSSVQLAPEGEPGIPLIISGKVYTGDTSTPSPGLLIYLYQVDATGEYHRDKTTRIPRLNGWVKTDKKGSYEIRTVRPSSYPDSRVVAHIHAFVRFPDGRRTWIQDFLFADDPYLSDRGRERSNAEGSFSRIVSTKKGSDGILRGIRDIVVER